MMEERKTSQIEIYQAKGGAARIDVRLDGETVWLTQAQIGFLFQTERSVITKHLRNIFNDNELQKSSVCAKFAHTATDGKIYQTNFYNLDAIISVGYRVNSRRATQFRASFVFRDEESQLCRREQAHRGGAVYLLPAEERASFAQGWR